MAAIAIDGPLRGREIEAPAPPGKDVSIVADGRDGMPYAHLYRVDGAVATHQGTEPLDWDCVRCGRVGFRQRCCGACKTCCDCAPGANPYREGRC